MNQLGIFSKLKNVTKPKKHTHSTARVENEYTDEEEKPPGSNMCILHASDAFFSTNGNNQYFKRFHQFLEEIEDSLDYIIFTGNMGLSRPLSTEVPVVYVEGDYERPSKPKHGILTHNNNVQIITEPKQLFLKGHNTLILPKTPDKNNDEFIKNIQGNEIDIIISPSGPIDTHFLKEDRTYEILFDIAYFRSPRLWLSGHYKFFPYYQTIVPVRNNRKKFANVLGVNTSYGYVEIIDLDKHLNILKLELFRLFPGHGRQFF